MKIKNENRKKTTFLYKVCWAINCLLLGYLFAVFILIFAGYKEIGHFFFYSKYSECILLALTIPTLLLLIKNHIICYKKDTAAKGLLLFFLNIFYNPIYYLRIHKKGWI